MKDPNRYIDNEDIIRDIANNLNLNVSQVRSVVKCQFLMVKLAFENTKPEEDIVYNVRLPFFGAFKANMDRSRKLTKLTKAIKERRKQNGRQ